MTSVFDQFEQASQRSRQVAPPPIRPDIVSNFDFQLTF